MVIVIYLKQQQEQGWIECKPKWALFFFQIVLEPDKANHNGSTTTINVAEYQSGKVAIIWLTSWLFWLQIFPVNEIKLVRCISKNNKNEIRHLTSLVAN